MEAASIAQGHAEHHGPPPAHQSSRVHAPTLGMLLFIMSEIMIFGAFFTAYFFIRVVTHNPWPARGTAVPEAVAGVNTAILLSSSLTLHWALTSVKNGNRFGLRAGMASTFMLGLTFLFIQVNEYIHLGWAPHDSAQATVFYSLTGLHGAHVFIGLCLLLIGDHPRLPRALLARAPRRHGSARHLLALRRHHVDHRVHVGLRAVAAVLARWQTRCVTRRTPSGCSCTASP